MGSAGAAAQASLIEIAALSGLALFCQFCHAAGPTSTSPACIEITAFFQLVSFWQLGPIASLTPDRWREGQAEADRKLPPLACAHFSMGRFRQA